MWQAFTKALYGELHPVGGKAGAGIFDRQALRVHIYRLRSEHNGARCEFEMHQVILIGMLCGNQGGFTEIVFNTKLAQGDGYRAGGLIMLGKWRKTLLVKPTAGA